MGIGIGNHKAGNTYGGSGSKQSVDKICELSAFRADWQAQQDSTNKNKDNEAPKYHLCRGKSWD